MMTIFRRMTLFSNAFINLALLLSITMTVSLSVQAADGDTGVVKGKIDFCGNGGVDGMLVYVPGRQFLVVTGEDGRFVFDDLQSGQYSLSFKNGSRVFKLEDDIHVFKQRVVDLGVIALCDPVGTIISGAGQASSVPIVTSVPASSSSASSETTEEAPADIVLDDVSCIDGTLVSIPGGTGSCSKGLLSVYSCNKGQSDCDGKVENGCEVNLLDDNENCGACGNECSSLEICSVGIC